MGHITELRQSVTEFAETLELPPFVHKLNELLNQRAWEQAAIEEKLATQKIADMWAIVQKVATTESARKEPYSDDSWECPFCDGLSKPFSQDVAHEMDCIVMKARKMVETPEWEG